MKSFYVTEICTFVCGNTCMNVVTLIRVYVETLTERRQGPQISRLQSHMMKAINKNTPATIFFGCKSGCMRRCSAGGSECNGGCSGYSIVCAAQSAVSACMSACLIGAVAGAILSALRGAILTI